MNKQLTERQAKLILVGAIYTPILIITVSDKVALEIKSDIMDAAWQVIAQNICLKEQRYRILVKGYESIAVMPSERWNAQKSVINFKGDVLITNRKITEIPRILRQPILITDYLDRLELLYGKGGQQNER